MQIGWLLFMKNEQFITIFMTKIALQNIYIVGKNAVMTV